MLIFMIVYIYAFYTVKSYILKQTNKVQTRVWGYDGLEPNFEAAR